MNIGVGKEILIRDLAKLIQKVVGYKGTLFWDASRPDGQPRRRLDAAHAWQTFGFKAATPFEEGLRKTVNWFLKNQRSKTFKGVKRSS